jgi:hypothetical protein
MTDDKEDSGKPLPDRDMLLYDYFKHLSGLVLITLGGLLIVMKDLDAKDVNPKFVTIIFILIAMSGVLSFGGTNEIVRERYTGKTSNWRRRSLQASRYLAPNLLAAGLGLFLAMFTDNLTH